MAPQTAASAVDRPDAMNSFSTEDDLDKVWAEIIIRCSKITKWDLNDKKVMTVDDVLLKLKPPKDGKPDVKDKAKKVFRNTLVCVQRFGAFAAQAASMVFGPSQQCFNAITFVITAVEDYDAVFNNITTLMERVSTFLERLRIFLDDAEADVKLDKRLRVAVYRVLEHFLTIMGLAHRLTHGWKGKLKLAAKIGAFGEDDGVKDAMARLETLISTETDMEISVIAKDMSDAAKNIRGMDKKLDQIADAQEKTNQTLGHLETAEQRRTADEEEKKRLNDIREALNIDMTKRPWIDKQDELWGKHIDGTGNWLLKFRYPSFPRWSDPKEPDTNVLSIKADEGFGKSHLCSIAVNHLQEKHRDDARVGVAYYYFQRDVQDKTPINKAIKAIIYQLASASTSLARDYAKLIHKACDRKMDFGKTVDLWKRLVTDIALEGTFFILLDGFDEGEKETGKPLADIIGQIMSAEEGSMLKIRLFITGRPAGLDSLADDVESAIPEIRIAPPQGEQSSLNEEDIMLYAEERLDDMDIFKDDDDEVAELKERAKTELGEGVQGDYFALDYKLDSISRSRNSREVQEILKLAKESRTQAIARKIDQLNETLREDEVREVNKLLTWETVCFVDLSVDQYEAVLKLEADTRSLISLEKQIRDRYFSLFDISESKNVTLKSDGIRDYLREKEEAANPRENGSHRPDAALQEGEVALVKRILKTHFSNTFGGDDMYEKFAFDGFFESKIGDQAARIRLLGDGENHVRVAQACLVAACDHFEEELYEDLHPYAWEWFADHLARVEIEEVDTPTKQDIGRKLVRILREDSLIDVWWNEDRIMMRLFWVYKTFCSRAVYDWLKDPVVQKGLSDMPSERQWVVATTAEDGPPVKILENVAKRLAQHWYAQNTGMWFGAFSFLQGYLSHLRDEEPEEIDATAKETRLIEEWARTVIPGGEEGKWHHCLAATYFEINCFKESVTRFKAALEASPNDWRVSNGLAQALAENDQHEEAVKTLEKLIEDNQALISTDDDFKEEYWDSMLHSIGVWNIQMKDFAAAELTYKKLLAEGMAKETFETFAKKAVLLMTLALNRQSKHRETMDLLASLEQRPDPEAGDWLSALFHFYAGLDQLHDRVFEAAYNSDQLSTVVEKYRLAVDKLRSDKTKFGTYLHLRHWLAASMWSHESREEQEAALDMWEEIMNMELPDGSDEDYMISWARSSTAPQFAVALLDSAKQAGLTTPLSPAAEQYATRLEKLTHGDPDYVRGSYDDVRISLARLHHLAGDEQRAKGIVREILKTGLQLSAEQTMDSLKDGLYRVAVVLQAMDDDANAVAAWRSFTPKKPSAGDDEDSQGDDGENGADEEVDKKSDQSNGKAVDGFQKPDAEADQAVAGAERDDGDSNEGPNPVETKDEQHSDEPEVEQASGETTEDDSKPPDAKEEGDPLAGVLGSHCDGHCGVEWTYVDNIYSCKDCLDVQLEPNCYAKLQNGTLDPKVCSKNHSHIYIPPFDRQKWEELGDDEMWVGEGVVKIKDWIEEIKRQWGIDEQSLRAKERFTKAITKIQKAWKFYKVAGKV
ncbi:hypothetical protein M409DRAFT_22079 [Zasmidium cellare ATCC 36951]|uniref:Uncharacterized protein n=1 Tax=Zasmidium cellare ATCC 36951 TaxID=1080233 RepID=A0A6A6CL50_ZASCE|nr:uncharacterized protein M409DRAFT_22079 [Zasmidium cellare ATCC 36951]KAF2167934.1 hypothetical protein M409DRAFT_22079 [Zasmidium cellare ATCC 36951]